MRAWCPHCGAQNEFSRAPTSAVVYCQKCRKPFGVSSLLAKARSAQASPQPRQPSETGGPEAPRRRASASALAGSPPDFGDEPSWEQGPESKRRPRRPVGPVIIPKSRTPAPGPGTTAKLVYRSPDGLVTDFELEDHNTLGRHPKNRIRLNDREISKEHAVIERRNGEFVIKDLNSSNGTYVNNRRVHETVLQDGDEILLGSMRLNCEFQTSDEEKGDARNLVTILPQDPAGSTHIHAKIEDRQHDFLPVEQVTDVEVLKQDYEKLRLTHALSRLGLTTDLGKLLGSTLDVVFSMLPADNAVIMLVDEDTNTLVPHTIRRRQAHQEDEEIILSSAIVNGVVEDRSSVLLSDAFIDPRFSGSQSIIAQGIRAAMCVPLVAHSKVLGILHLDTRERVGAFNEKDLQLLKAIANQTAIAIENIRLVRQIEEEAKTRGQLSRFLPPHVVEEMVQGKGRTIQKGGREVEASVVFCDIRGFTSMSETSGPQEVVELLNEYFERLVEVVFARRGVLDKFIGDALMASWGAIEGQVSEDPVFDCVAAAIEFRDTIRELNEERDKLNLPRIQMGVGVNTGRLVAGYMGSKRRLEFTVIGDAVNTASRICGIAGGDQVLISEATYRHVADRIEARYLGTREVKGKAEELGVYEALRLGDGQ
ncbi:MAG TPA: adenylate/guanylate cyclase domain-containing protein [Myxococcales bacterium LLY-WYZ-16_1]|jgi:adenylate cyclase|nr:adenylate/guanylate cyclase domain-containing protein [Myxococcales bacterium LLY-WYZ-16_1]